MSASPWTGATATSTGSSHDLRDPATPALTADTAKPDAARSPARASPNLHGAWCEPLALAIALAVLIDVASQASLGLLADRAIPVLRALVLLGALAEQIGRPCRALCDVALGELVCGPVAKFTLMLFGAQNVRSNPTTVSGPGLSRSDRCSGGSDGSLPAIGASNCAVSTRPSRPTRRAPAGPRSGCFALAGAAVGALTGVRQSPPPESNRKPLDYKSSALPIELGGRACAATLRLRVEQDVAG